MIKLTSLICESDNWNNWVNSMVSTVLDVMEYEGDDGMDDGQIYDIIKSDFRANAPSEELFQKACKEDLQILKRNHNYKRYE